MFVWLVREEDETCLLPLVHNDNIRIRYFKNLVVDICQELFIMFYYKKFTHNKTFKKSKNMQ